MRFLMVLSLVFSYLTSAVAFSEKQKVLKKSDFTTWPLADVKEFGCFLEREFGHKDKKFNCSLGQYINKGDPCKNTSEYYEGPKFPKEFAERVNAKVDSIDLSWEHGLLQSVSITFKNKYSEEELRKSFHLPVGASIQDCSKTNTCVILTGFDHVGVGDMDCDAL